jgi:signal transduction histidine kinase
VAALGITASLAGAAMLRNTDRAANTHELHHRVELAQRAVTDEVQRYVDTISLVAASAGAQPQLDRDAYLALTQPLLNAKLPGATGVVFVVPASDDQVAATQAQWRGRGVPDLRLHPEGTGREHFFSIFNRTLDGAAAPPAGVDVAQAAEPAAALAEARRGGATVLSRPYLLLRDRGLPAGLRQLSFLLAAPVLGPADTAGRRPFRGWIVAGLRGQDFTGAVLRSASEGLTDANLYATGADGRPIQVAEVDGLTGRGDLTREITIPVAQQRWALHGSGPSHSAGHLPLWVACGGILFAIAIAGLVLVLMTARDRARSQVVRATRRLEGDIAWREIVETELRQARDALGAQQAYLGGLLDSLDVAVVACDNDGRITLENAYSRRLGAPTMFTHLDGTPFDGEELPLTRTLREGSVDGVEILHHGAGRRAVTLLAHGRTLFAVDGSRVGAVVTGYDITELRDHERELTGFAAVAAHDLKSPLAVISAYTELLADDATGEASHLLGRIDAGVKRMRRLIDDLLSYSTARHASPELADVDLRQVVTDVVAARTDHLRLTTGGQFPDVYVGPLPAVHADPAMLRQLVDNLVGNALKYVRPSTAARVDVTAARVDVTAAPAGGWVRVEIADRGIGIPRAERDTVFEPFHRARTEHAYGGTGLGLAICQRIVDRHGGRIGVTDNAGGGTRFFFTLPAAVGATTPAVAGTLPAVAGTAPVVAAVARTLPAVARTLPAVAGTASAVAAQPPESASSAPSGTTSASGLASQPSGSATLPGEFVRPRG